MKTKTLFICENCGYQSNKWVGKCSNCDKWNTFKEETVMTGTPKKTAGLKAIAPRKLSSMSKAYSKIPTNIEELDRVLGGGIVSGSVTLLSGEPGIGKSTITLQICETIARQNKNVLYISGEEGLDQISMRAQRLGITSENIQMISTNSLEEVLGTLEAEKPDFAIIDSIQTISSENVPSTAGSSNQIKLCAEAIISFAKTYKIPIFIIGHVVKDGALAGPKTLEHVVDAVIYIEGERYQNLRIFRGTKNRFGSTNEVGIFEMAENGLKEVKNPSSIFIDNRNSKSSGTVVTVAIEGTRPFLIEVQALTNYSNFGYPKRTANGFDLNRLQMLIAVLEKHANIKLQNQDVFINIAGGLRLTDPAADLAILLAIASSIKKIPIPHDLCAIGEVGLTGETRPIAQLARRVMEAEKLGFKQIVISQTKENISSKAEVIQIKMIRDAMKLFTS
ncbi:MAG: hypothetical protein UT33_C0011G0047 [Candidatus Peregrinibacteria bacterium GW2011_GWC2_39_14]|nr:MAG: hypothetical protein UT33_C0011G0047 [Candidatus Peregrinibacteria bacterium GW2011_GWC2_39_14]